jgi:hypothetical protein
MLVDLAALLNDLTEMALLAYWLDFLVEQELAHDAPMCDRRGPPQYALAA